MKKTEIGRTGETVAARGKVAVRREEAVRRRVETRQCEEREMEK